MPVSLERLMVELEPNVITDTLTRECIQIQGGDPDAAADKKKSMRFREVEVLAFSFKSIAVINNLRGLDNLTKLQLDNNQITKIENLGHLSSLTWLDLSFNKIAVIEGLEALTKLVDLSLFNNRIAKIEGLNTLTALNVLSLGNNSLAALDNVMYLRQFRCLRLVNLAGNAICKEHDYRSYVLSHVRNLTYLDYRRVAAADVQSAVEQHQDEMIEISEREEQAQSEAKLAGERALHNGLMKEANLDGVETLIEDMVREDPEWARLTQVPGLTDPWNDIRDKFTAATDEFKLLILDAHARKKAEHAEWTAAVAGVMGQHDADAQAQVRDYERLKKKTIRTIQENPVDSDPKTLVLGPKVKLLTLKDGLLDIEMEVVELLAGLLQEFDRNYSEIADANKALYNAYFTQVRDLQNTFFNQLSTLAITLYDKYNQENSDVDSLPEEARVLLQDKDGLSNALQASHDSHMSRIDGLEDRLVGTELRGANELTSKNVGWASSRNRGRVTEIINYIERNMAELDELAGEEEAGDA